MLIIHSNKFHYDIFIHVFCSGLIEKCLPCFSSQLVPLPTVPYVLQQVSLKLLAGVWVTDYLQALCT